MIAGARSGMRSSATPGSDTARGVERVVYTSTVGCIGIPPTGIGDEDTPVSLATIPEWGFKSFLAEHPEVAFRLLQVLSQRVRQAEGD